jgi:outer membrane protein OmpA-like peptidoglycan-associated protein
MCFIMNPQHPPRRSRPRPPLLLPPLLGVVLLSASPAAADVGLAVHAEGSAAHAVGNLKGEQYGWGGAGLVGVELTLGRVVGIELPVGLLGLSAGEQPPAYMRTSSSAAFFTTPGVRLRPLALIDNPWARSVWLAGGVGVAVTGARPYPAVSARAGFEAPLGRLSLGPYASLVQIIDPGGALAMDARVVTAGLSATFGVWSRSPRPATAPAPEPPPAAPPVALADEDGAPVAEDAPVITPIPAAPVVAERTAVEQQPRFASGDATLQPSAAAAIERVLSMIAARPSYDAVIVSGHADDVGSDDFNLRLSERRALTVVEMLVKRGVDRARIRVEPFGSTRPLRAERTPEARRENRRVEIEIVWRKNQEEQR